MNKKVIYIISEYFAPFHNVGSVKFTKISKFLSRNPQYDIIVFTRKNCKCTDILLAEDLKEIRKNGGKVYFINEGKKYSKKHGFAYSLFQNVIIKLIGYNCYYYFSNIYSARLFKRNALWLIKKKSLPKPDCVISTFDDWGAHFLAMDLKQKYKNSITWIADFRDPVGAVIKKGIFRKLCDRFTYSVTKEADYTTVISEGLLKVINIYPKAKCYVASNGYDYEDYEKVLAEKKKLHFAYTGSFYNHTLLPFFQAVRELIDEGKIDEKNIIIEYAGSYGKSVYKEMKKAKLEKCFINKGELTRYQAIQLQSAADVLLASVWNYKDDQGVMAGKTMAYLMLKKPILAVVKGDLKESDMKKLITTLNCGFCYEEANHKEDFVKLKEFIFNLYNLKLRGETILQAYNGEVEKYNLKVVAEQYENILKLNIDKQGKRS